MADKLVPTWHKVLYPFAQLNSLASCITFTDHAPYPGDLFGNRMEMKQLPEYISTLQELKKRYNGKIEIKIGLECEYLPCYEAYIRKLRSMEGMDTLLLGQHFYEVPRGKWSFNLVDMSMEWKGIINAEMEGIATGLFDVVAHPDRAFKKCNSWTDEMESYSRKLIRMAFLNGNIPLEKNMASKRKKNNFWNEFWELVPDYEATIYGCDAHFVSELQLCDKEQFESI